MDSIMLSALVSTIIAWSTPSIPPSSTPSANQQTQILASKTYSLANRYADPFVNGVFSDNILLTLAYMSGQVKQGDTVLWDKLRAPATYTFTLKPLQTFAFHDKVLDKYKSSLAATTNAHFNSSEGFKSDGWLVGDGVCHLASFLNVVAQTAGLKVESPRNHDFAAIPEVSKEFGTAIYYDPNDNQKSQLENLYITNTTPQSIRFVIIHANNILNIQVESFISDH